MSAPDRSARYDRQLRLWAANGQAALERSRVALIGGDAAGSETLKNLVLPGIGGYTVVDGRRVSAADTGRNFFIDVGCIGRSRTEVVCAYLQELNPDVRGQALDADPARLVREDVKYFTDNFDLVLVAELDAASTLRLSEILWDAAIPLVIVQTVGFTGYLRIAVPEHAIVETHPDAIMDLRLDVPWSQLSDSISSMDLESMNDNEHTHVPYVLLLLHYLAEWKSSHDGRPPSTFDQKSDFKKLIRSGMRNSDEDNFDEAVNNVWRACGKTSVPSEVTALFESPSAQNLSATTSDFWFLVRAVADFVRGEGAGLLPLSGTVPDMKSDTTRYIKLQNIYRSKAQADTAIVKAHLQGHLVAHGRPADAIPDTEIAVFCKHAAFIKVISYRSLAQEHAEPSGETLRDALSADPEAPILWYLALRAAEVFYERNARRPGAIVSGVASPDASYTEDAEALVAIARALPIVAAASLPAGSLGEPLEDVCTEWARAGHGSLHNVASLMGGIASQEIIKLLTRQYVPANNTVVFDGIKSVTAVYTL